MDVGDLNRVTFEYGPVSTESLELTQAMAIDSPPVFTSPHIITLQPQGELEDRPNPRVIPARAQDWISTPRSQMSALSGNHFLGNVEQLEIQQIVDLSTLLGRVERGLQYRVKVPNAETLFLAMESRPASESVGFSCSRFIRDDHTLNVMDQWGEPAFIMKINSRWSYTLTKLRKITVGSSNLIGTVEENFSVMGPSFTVYDSERNQLCNISGPNICGCCMYKEAQFQVISVDGTHQIATLMHQWNNTLHDYSFLIIFPAETDIKLKSLLLAATFLLEYIYFG